MEINFECKKCRREFDCEVGEISLSDDQMRPVFEKVIICPVCGKLSIDDMFLTKLGQNHMTEATWDL
jgi:transcription elongation factor Elf1